jgi:hypothetical protein
MDLNYLHETLSLSLAQFHQPVNIRYRNIAFSSKDLGVLDDITQSLRRLLPEYGLWVNPGVMNAPESAISRKTFLDTISSLPREGLIIQQPAQWLNHWPLTEKQAFWSTLGLWHGGLKIITVFAAGDEFQQINNAYYKAHVLEGLPIKLWLPARANQPE